MAVELTITVRDATGATRAVGLRNATAEMTVSPDGALRFAIADGEVLYLSSSGNSRFKQPPAETALALEAEREYVLRGAASADGGRAELWLIQYDAATRLKHDKVGLHGGGFTLRWTTAARYAGCVLALRLTGQGRVALQDLTLEEVTPTRAAEATPLAAEVRTGPEGRFQAYSIFADPAGYKPYTERHHRHYADRGPEWYADVAREFADCERVLEIGCGPGLLLQALRTAGVRSVVGVERDPVYLEACRARGLDVHAHDLNLPLAFLPGGQFDALVAHYAFEYLAPTAQRMLLREARRLLRPSGRLVIIARHDGQASGDGARGSSCLTEDLLHAWLAEAGLEARLLTVRGNRIRCEAVVPVGGGAEIAPLAMLRNGQPVRPWGIGREVLAAEPGAWDTAAGRDFTLLADAQKDLVRVDGQWVAYYTGYREVGDAFQRAVLRATSADGKVWTRTPLTPVLEAGPAGQWDAGGVAAGSVLPSPDAQRGRYVMYYTGRDEAGVWPGIGLACSADGVHWERQAERVLRVEDFEGLRYLALADVIRLANGRWLMHCEGWVTADGGWAIVQAESDDGLVWRPTQPTPVLRPADVAWAGKHVANPKVLPLAADHLLLGFNGADASRAFQLGLAESVDGRRWTELPANPVIGTRGGHRAESFFMTRDAWRDGTQRVYYFEAAGNDTFRSSHVLTAEAANSAADAGSVRHVALDRETQVLLRVAGRATGAETQCELVDDGAGLVVRVGPTGCVALGTREIAAARPGVQTVSVLLRVINPTRAAELCVHVWHDAQEVAALHEPLAARPQTLRVACPAADAESPAVETCDVWQPEPCAVDGLGDAHTGMGVVHGDDPFVPDVGAEQFAAQLAAAGVGRALVVPYAGSGVSDTFDEATRLLALWPGRVAPLVRITEWATGKADEQFQIDQLELLWQQGLLGGLKVNLGRAERPSDAVLEWVAQRQVLTHWHAGSDAELDWLEERVLRRFTFPVLLAHFGGYPLARRRYARSIEWLGRYAETYLVTSVVFYRYYLEAALQQFPTRVLMGSDLPGVDVCVARAAIDALDVPAATKTLALGENLRFLMERCAWQRWLQMRNPETLRFPLLPASAAEVATQGFEVVPVDEMPADEDTQAKAYWSEHVSNFYLEPKPWSRFVAENIAAMGAKRVLEFGCHAGRNLAAIRARLPDAELVGLDINAAAVAAGRERYGLDLRVGNERTLAEFADGAFDAVFTVSVLDHVPQIERLCAELVRVAKRAALFLEVTLPIEGKVLQHFDHREGRVRESTAASYSWDVARFIQSQPRVWRLDVRPVYVQRDSLGPYYMWYRAYLNP